MTQSSILCFQQKGNKTGQRFMCLETSKFYKCVLQNIVIDILYFMRDVKLFFHCNIFSTSVKYFVIFFTDDTGVRLTGFDEPNIGILQIKFENQWTDACYFGSNRFDRIWDYRNLQVRYRGTEMFQVLSVMHYVN